MQDVLSFEVLTLKELGAIASKARVPRWSRLKKAELIARLLQAGVVPPTVEELAARRREEREERLAQAAPLLPPTLDAPSTPNETPKSLADETNPDGKIKQTQAPAANGSRRVDEKVADERSPNADEKRTASNASNRPNAPGVGSKSSVPNDGQNDKTVDAPAAPNGSASVDAEKTTASPTTRAETSPSGASTADGRSPRQEKARSRKIIGSPTDENDRLALAVCDPFWLRAYWEATPRRVERVRSAMGQSWHTADPTLRLYRVDREPHGATRREFVGDFPVRGGVNSCYVPVDDPPQSFVVELGYLARDKRFFTLISSNVVETPQRYVHDAFGRPEENGLGFPTNFDAFVPPRRTTRPRFSPLEDDEPSFRPGALNGTARRDVDALRSSSDLRVAVDCEIVVKGKASPGARVRVKEETIRLKEDGAFSIRYRLPERRHVFPVVATSADGSETRTIVLAVDRNTKTLDPVFRDEETEE